LHKQRLNFIKSLALEAGQLTLEGFGRCGQMPKEGSDGYDIATIYDLRTEDLIKKRILNKFAEPVLGEEDGLIGDRELAKRKLWIADPIDGTFNYQRGLSLYGVSIAYCEEGVPACGAIYLPALRQLFFAAAGSGAFLVDDVQAEPKPISVSQEREVTRLVISVAGTCTYPFLAACAAEGVPWRSLRLHLCAVASLAHIAAGRMDAFVDKGLHLWDLAAGDVILREAGGPPIADYQDVPIFPEYVNRLLQNDDTSGFACLAASSQDLIEEPLKRLIASAGY
jgi:myo-inositol-1(or 4)-monophosphatase